LGLALDGIPPLAGVDIDTADAECGVPQTFGAGAAIDQVAAIASADRRAEIRVPGNAKGAERAAGGPREIGHADDVVAAVTCIKIKCELDTARVGDPDKIADRAVQQRLDPVVTGKRIGRPLVEDAKGGSRRDNGQRVVDQHLVIVRCEDKVVQIEGGGGHGPVLLLVAVRLEHTAKNGCPVITL